jgi:hypothetical protein
MMPKVANMISAEVNREISVVKNVWGRGENNIRNSTKQKKTVSTNHACASDAINARAKLKITYCNVKLVKLCSFVSDNPRKS